jgi:hypothetical protein
MDNLEIIIPKSNRCWDWPEKAEDRNILKDSEFFPDKMFEQILDFDEKYLLDYNHSIDFINNLEVPANEITNLTNKPGCLICGNKFIPLRIHYAMIRSLCDIKTVQYYLFSKGIFYREWYLKSHLNHIFVNTILEPEVLIQKGEKEIIQSNINDILGEIEQYKKIGGVKNNGIVINLRKDLKEWMQLKSNLDVVENEKTNIVTFNELKTKMFNVNN